MYEFYRPTRILIGRVIEEVGSIVSSYGKKLVVLVGPNTSREWFVDVVTHSLEEEGLKVEMIVVKGKKNNIDYDLVKRVAKELRKANPDLIVALGGGGIIDLAKAASLAATHKGDFWEYRIKGKYGISYINDTLIPVVAIPTIFGSGAEVSPAAVVVRSSSKEVIVSPHMFPRAAIIDPRLPATADPQYIAMSGFDAFVHALEALVSTNSSLLSDSFAEKAIEIIVEFLPLIVDDPRNEKAQEKVAVASIFASYAIGMAGVGAIHALSNPLSAYFDIPHGLALAIVSFPVIKKNVEVVPNKFRKVLAALGVDHIDDSHVREIILGILRSFLKSIKLYPLPKLSEFGAREDVLAKLAENALNPDIETNPRKFTKKDVMEVYRSIL